MTAMKPIDRTTFKTTARPVRQINCVDDVLDEIVRLLARIAAERDHSHFLATGRSPYDEEEVESLS